MEIAELVAVLAASLGVGGGGAAAWHRWGPGGTSPHAADPSESRISKREAAQLAKDAASRATKDAELAGALAALRDSIQAHESRDAERFDASERRASERHVAMMAEIERHRSRLHQLNDRVQVQAVQIDELRRETGLVTNPGVPPRPKSG